MNSTSKRELGERYPGLDIRADGGYAVFTGRNESGTYQWLREPKLDPLDTLPGHLRAFLGLERPPKAKPVLNGAVNVPLLGSTLDWNGRVSSDELIRRALDKVARGEGRNDSGFWLAAQLRDNGYVQSEAETVLLDYQRRVPPANTKGQREPYRRDEALASVREAYKRTPRDPWTKRQGTSTVPVNSPERNQFTLPRNSAEVSGDTRDLLAARGGQCDPDTFQRTDLGNAEYLAERCRDELRYCHPWKKWLAWDDRRWAVDTSGAVYRKAAETVRSFYQCAAGLQDEDKRQKLASWGLKCESRAKLESMIALAQNQAALIIQPEELDSDPWLICIRNGVLDLRTGQLREHTREALISKLCPVAFDSSAKAPTFERFLDRITRGSTPLLGYLQRFAGYCLTGNTQEQIMAVWHGLGANGKSTLQDCLLELLGDYGATTPSETLMARHGSPAIPNDVARLQGIRLAAAFETGTNSRLNEGFIKQATGGDRLSARFLHAEFFEFNPQFKIILSCNHKPRIIGTDNGIWRRVHMVPFDVTIPEPERDKGLPEKLQTELPGVLNWALAGCLEWQKRGLDPPPEVKTATENYRQDMDSLGVFITECCELNRHARLASSRLYSAYKTWAESAGERAVSQRMLGSLLKERGLESRRSGSSGRYEWYGISLKNVQ